MGAAFLILIAIVTVGLVFLGDVYWMLDVENGRVLPGPDLFDRIGSALRTAGLTVLL